MAMIIDIVILFVGTIVLCLGSIKRAIVTTAQIVRKVYEKTQLFKNGNA
jgi:hypothetical protein